MGDAERPPPSHSHVGPGVAGDDVASAGLGTVVIFMVGVLAAGSAAALLIGGATTLGSQGQETTDKASGWNDGRVMVVQVQVERSEGGYTVLRELLQPASGTTGVDLSGFIFSLRVGDDLGTVGYGGDSGDAGFTARAVRDTDGSFQPDAPLMTEGDLVEIRVDLAALGLVLDSRDAIRQEVLPPDGRKMVFSFQAPLDLGRAPVQELLS